MPTSPSPPPEPPAGSFAARSVAEWAAAQPAARDTVLALAEHAVALQPAAEVAIQWYGRDEPVAEAEAEEARRVERTYRELADQLHALALDPVVAAPLGDLLQRHLELLRLALVSQRPPEGLGRVAGELVGFRDLLRRTARVRGRAVADVPGF